MDLNTIKRHLYKENPIANLLYINKSGIHYQTVIDGETIFFTIPFTDVGDAHFNRTESAKYLIRWIQLKPETPYT